jgi:hypothetical protein
MDMGQLFADRFGVHQISLQSYYFPSTEMSWLKDFKARLAKTKTRVAQINLEFGQGYNMGASASPQARLQMIDLHRVWLEKATFLECPRIMVNQGQINPETREQVIANYQAIVALAKERRITISSENRGGPPAAGRGGANRGGGGDRGGGGADRGGGGERGGGAGRGAAGEAGQVQTPAAPATPPAPAQPSYIPLTEVLKAAGAFNCVDFMNFPDPKTQLEGIRATLPNSNGLVHVSMTHPLEPAMAICRELGYKGIYAIKAYGVTGEGDPLELTQKIIDGVLANM